MYVTLKHVHEKIDCFVLSFELYFLKSILQYDFFYKLERKDRCMDSQEVISSENIYTALRVRIFHIMLKYIQ